MVPPANPFHALLAMLVAASFAGCASSSAKPSDTPETASASPSPDPAPADSAAEGKSSDAPASSPAPKKDDRDAIPDDYTLTAGDCGALGRQYGGVARSDQMASLSPKLKEKQRAQGEASIEKVVSKLEENWISLCERSLVGQVVDRAALKCALNSATVKAFDICLNGEAGATTNKPVAPRNNKKK